ncbi:MAG: aldo/keto reductase [Leptolyngbyaceae cyanobacterium bins.349]|nr:aldo/keto reductase [Leptolyngbyaceae cyanobacterium bins.349]
MLSESLQTATLGPTHITVPALGIGTWQWGDKLFWSYGKDYGSEQVREAFHAAVQAGITFFDTAEIYGFGESERLIGQFIKESDRPIQVATKYFPMPWRFSAQAVEEALTASLKRLQLDSIPLYQVHMPFDFLMGQRTLMNALADEVEKGRIGAIGISNYSAEQMRKAHKYLTARGIPLAVNQVRYSLLTRQIESNGILETARELGITILAYSPLAQGLLTGKYTPESAPTPEGARRLDTRFSQKGLEQIAPLINALKQIGETHQRTPAQVALNWLIAQGNVVPIPGAKNASQAQQNAGALGWNLTSDEVAQLDALSRDRR